MLAASNIALADAVSRPDLRYAVAAAQSAAAIGSNELAELAPDSNCLCHSHENPSRWVGWLRQKHLVIVSAAVATRRY